MAVKEECAEDKNCCAPFRLIRKDVTNMDARLTQVEAKVYSPTVIVAVFAFLGTCVSVAGSILSVFLISVAKSQGWM